MAARYGLLLIAVFGAVVMTAITDPGWQPTTVEIVYDPVGDFYAYAPSVIVEGDIEHIWTCHNAVDGHIKDSIYYTRRENGAVIESRPILAADNASAWDSYHVCDPSVIAGDFAFGGNTYAYALFYLGNNVDASAQNQIGVAFAHELAADQWVKYPEPVVAYDGKQWGVGQPSAVSLGGGRVLLVYTKGHDGTITYRQEFDLSDLDTGVVATNEPRSLTNLGLTGRNGRSDYLNNIDIAYDPAQERFFAVREQHPYPTTYPTYIGASLQLVSIPAERIFNGGGQWTVEGVIDASVTGLARNHNAGITRAADGTLADPTRLRVVFADSCGEASDCQTAEWTYDLWAVTGHLNP